VKKSYNRYPPKHHRVLGPILMIAIVVMIVVLLISSAR
jgi:hypothetical protein